MKKIKAVRRNTSQDYYSKEEVSKRVDPKTIEIVKRGIAKYRFALEKLAKE